MLEEEIIKKRKELNESIEQENNYEITYKLSVELDELIALYYEKKSDLNLSNQKEAKILYLV